MRGKVVHIKTADFFCTDHPRLCGEKRMEDSKLLTATGSPPPMRGKVRTLGAARERRRITPAYAGKSYIPKSDASAFGDHPRLCGEKWQFPEIARI